MSWPAFLLMVVFASVAGSTLAEECPIALDRVLRGDEAARADHHEAAIRAYEDAIRLDPDLRLSLLPKLGRQYLWWDQPARATELFREYLERDPEDCGVRSDQALALSWDDRLREARDAYRELRACPGLGQRAKLGEARVLRWMDRPSAAARLYREVAADASEPEQTQARLGLALVALQSDRNRAARERFTALQASGFEAAEVAEGLAVAELRLGAPERARDTLRGAEAAGIRDARLDELARHLERLTRPAARTTSNAFWDGDGTRYLQLEQAADGMTGLRTGWQAAIGFSRLSNDDRDQRIDGRWLSLGLEHRLLESLALRGDVSFTRYGDVDFEPILGEGRAVITPTDDTRMDLSVARITIADNLDALSNHLAGTFLSTGIDQRLTDDDTVALGFDWTWWSEGNRRARYRADLRRRFQGNPQLTLSWPTLFQTYDEGFEFPMFSPKRYLESSPALRIDWRLARNLRGSLHLRAGVQRESGGSWEPLGAVRASVELELARNGDISASAGYSNSSLSNSAGFRRVSLSLSARYRF